MSGIIILLLLFAAWEADWLWNGAIGLPGSAGRRFHQIGNWLDRRLS